MYPFLETFPKMEKYPSKKWGTKSPFSFRATYWCISMKASKINQFHFVSLSVFKTKMPYLWPSLKKQLLMWTCSLSVHAVCLSNYSEILAVDWWHLLDAQFHGWLCKLTNRISAHRISIYGNVSLLFLERILSIISIFYLALL